MATNLRQLSLFEERSWYVKDCVTMLLPIWAHAKHCSFQTPQGQSNSLAAHVTQFNKSPNRFTLKNSTVWGRRETQNCKTKASERDPCRSRIKVWGATSGRDKMLGTDHNAHSWSPCAVGQGEEVERSEVKERSWAWERVDGEKALLVFFVSHHPTVFF